MALLDRIHELNRALPNRKYFRFYVNGKAVGFVDTQILPELDSELFAVDYSSHRICCHFTGDDRIIFENRIEQFFRNYFAKHQLSGWRDERYAVSQHINEAPLFLLERAALSFLGITGYGVHISGYVEKNDGLYVWVAKRARTKSTSPGKLDQMVAGGVPYGISPLENVIKECQEEASIPREIAQQAIPVSAISYAYDLPIGLRPDVMLNYDLRLPDDVMPHVNDDEVESFTLRPINDVLEQIASTQDFKFNSAAVIIDFAIRHGVITPDHHDYVALSESMTMRWKRFGS